MNLETPLEVFLTRVFFFWGGGGSFLQFNIHQTKKVKYCSFNDRCTSLWVSGTFHTTPEEFENATITGHFEFVFEENSSGKSHDYREVIVFEKLHFQSVFCPHENEKPAFSNSSGLKSVFEKLRLRDGLVWTEGLTVEIKLRFQISPAQYSRCPLSLPRK